MLFAYNIGEKTIAWETGDWRVTVKEKVLRVLVVDQNKKFLMTCQPAKVRGFLMKGRATVLRCYSFLRLKIGMRVMFSILR